GAGPLPASLSSLSLEDKATVDENTVRPEEGPKLNAGRLPASQEDGLMRLSRNSSSQLPAPRDQSILKLSTQSSEMVLLPTAPSPSASISSPGRTASRSTGPPEKDAPAEVRYMRAAQLLQDAFNGPAEREPEPQPGNEADHSPAKMRTMQMSWSSLPLEQTTTPRSMAPAPAPRPVVPARFVSACSRTLSTSAFASSSPGQEHREIHVPPASARLRWSFSDAHVAHNPQVITAPTPWRAVTSVPLASNPRSVSPTRLVASTASWTPPSAAPILRSPRRSVPMPGPLQKASTSASSTPQPPLAPPMVSSAAKSLPVRTGSLQAGTGTPQPPGQLAGARPILLPSARTPPQANTSFTSPAVALTPAPAMPAFNATQAGPVRCTIGAVGERVHNAPAPEAGNRGEGLRLSPRVPTPVQGAQQSYVYVGVPGGLQTTSSTATQARQSLGRRMWKSGNGKAIGPPNAHHNQEVDENLTSVCVKLQQRLGKLSTKKTIAL
ncbi:unnamed protein product, partial [Symbiodinium microadriaticum]